MKIKEIIKSYQIVEKYDPEAELFETSRNIVYIYTQYPIFSAMTFKEIEVLKKMGWKWNLIGERWEIEHGK